MPKALAMFATRPAQSPRPLPESPPRQIALRAVRAALDFAYLAYSDSFIAPGLPGHLAFGNDNAIEWQSDRAATKA